MKVRCPLVVQNGHAGSVREHLLWWEERAECTAWLLSAQRVLFYESAAHFVSSHNARSGQKRRNA